MFLDYLFVGKLNALVTNSNKLNFDIVSKTNSDIVNASYGRSPNRKVWNFVIQGMNTITGVL